MRFRPQVEALESRYAPSGLRLTVEARETCQYMTDGTATLTATLSASLVNPAGKTVKMAEQSSVSSGPLPLTVQCDATFKMANKTTSNSVIVMATPVDGGMTQYDITLNGEVLGPSVMPMHQSFIGMQPII